ncbi:hypothetical protein LNN35_20485 [Pseudomonas stutzeri]|uniref:P-loop ATPase, Sll1717 family n=1 Tax=Stutzerimonas stutzeri TaxID=316 RepID=UPI001E399D59|nr:hypothetical protein [Stutzerimonas stutzeri]MCC8345143.1 hypothetical protein [Stutzerimonas stutzeri]
MTRDKSSYFKEISGWKLDAKLEDNDRYFYLAPDVESLLRGERAYVIGRKGTGKTAIASFIKKKKDYCHFAISLTLKNFPFNQLYAFSDNRYTSPNEYITIWKYIVYVNLLYLMVDNEGVDAGLRAAVKKVMPCDPKAALSRKLNVWTSAAFNIGFSELSAGLDISRTSESVDLNWVERTQVLEQVIFEKIDTSSYFILFDELDEDYKYQSIFGENKQYLDLISGLFKAVQDIKSISIERGVNVNPVIFLRDDIYDLIQDPDKTKWGDLAVDLKWNKSEMQSLIAHRLARAAGANAKKVFFGETWHEFFARESIKVGLGREKEISIYDWITKNTLLRPRDYIKYLQLCAKKAYEANYRLVRASTLTMQDITYSSYLRGELVDEIHSILPDIVNIFDLISKLGKAHFSVDDFSSAYQKAYESGEVKNKNPRYVLNILFFFSVIGNHFSDNKIVFRYMNREASLNLDCALVVHRGLYKSLQLF